MKKKIKYSLMGLGFVGIVTLPIVSVVSCSEIVRNSDTNTYFAASLGEIPHEVSGSSDSTLLSTSQINNIIKTGTLPSSVYTTTSWYYDSTGDLVPNSKETTNSITSDTSSKPTTSESNYLSWLQTNNNVLVEELFTSILNYLVGPISTVNYLGQKINEFSEGSSGIFRCLSGIYNSIQSYNTQSSEQAFMNALVHPSQSANKNTTYYLYPAEFFYTVGQPTSISTNSSNYFLSNTSFIPSTSGYSALTADTLVGYMPFSNSTYTKTNNKVQFNNQITVAEVSNIQIVFEYYCSSSEVASYTNNQPFNCTTSENLPNSKYSLPANSTTNPYYGHYFVLNIDPVDVLLQNLGTKSSSKTSSDSVKEGSAAYYEQNYAALNYYNNYSPYTTSDNLSILDYNYLNSDGELTAAPGNDYFNSSWAFAPSSTSKVNNQSITSTSLLIQYIQNESNYQTQLFSQANSIVSSTTALPSDFPLAKVLEPLNANADDKTNNTTGYLWMGNFASSVK